MQWDFRGKVAVVTGGGRGIGRAIAVGLAAGGAEVHVFDRDAATDLPSELRFHAVNVADPASVAAAFEAIGKPVQLLCNNAGITRDRTLAKMSDDEWDAVLGVNLKGPFNTIRAFARALDANGGSIVNIVSINGLRGKVGQGNYAAAKGGLVALTKTAAKELGRKGVTVNAVAPGMVLTEMTLALDQKFRDAAMAEGQLNILPDTSDIANAVLFLLSPLARCITGEVIKVDSGQYV